MVIKLYEYRRRQKITLVRLSQLTGISKTTLNYIENGKTSPTLRQLESIAKAMNIRMIELFESEYK